MLLSRHKNHRNQQYLDWLKSGHCVASGKKAQVAHHVRFETNGGVGLKPSDYFCIPLTNEYHTTGLFAIHYIGGPRFFEHFKLNKLQLFIFYLKRFLADTYQIKFTSKQDDLLLILKELIDLAEQYKRSKSSHGENKTTKKINPVRATKISEGKFYKDAMEFKRRNNKKLRDKIKEDRPKVKGIKVSENPMYEKAKEYRKKKEKDLRDKNKEYLSDYRKKQYQKLKELRKS